jgi:ATP-dependent DNA helicase RecG
MAAALPTWCDAAFTAESPEIIAREEGAHTEFKRQVPDNTHDIAKDIVAFATSGGGVVLVGVSNTGEVVGFAEDSVEARDQKLSRVRGIVEKIQPKVKFETKLGQHECKSVLGVFVAREQSEPIFLSSDIVYVRDGASSRPASYAEIKELVWKHPSSDSRRKQEELALKRQQDFDQLMLDRRRAHDQEMAKMHEEGRKQREYLIQRLY